MKAKFINEKFVEDSDPIKDMGIGALTEKIVQREIKKRRGKVNDEIISDFIEELANKVGSGLDVYLDDEDMEELYHLNDILGKKRIKVIGFESDPERCPQRYSYDWRDTLEWYYDKKVQPWINKGWTEWRDEENGDYWEYILIKYDK